ncbi:MAG: 23S rRNA (adenine(2030)-N(6))-methyltransferase RlmJ [Treponema sp.]|nr:23S rRNA (adenine(2030)-N(6))-methyltransferase RlmJ [Treponema sp.]
MLSYQHAFHAGNHADILKHFVLTFVLNSLNKKEKAYTFFDSHSASGIYDFFDNRLIKTGEAQKGIQALLQKEEKSLQAPQEMQPYLNLIKEYAGKNLYPGSPEIERRLMRKQDFLVLSELHPQEIENLRRNMNHPLINNPNQPSIQIHNRNGWEMLKALTPPATKRGAILVDPSYEENQDYIDATKTICQINKKWSNGILMLWYPLLSHRESEIQAMLQTICDSAKSHNENVEISNIQLEVYSKEEKDLPRLYGSGMLVINSPWMLQETSSKVIAYIKSVISDQFQKED